VLVITKNTNLISNCLFVSYFAVTALTKRFRQSAVGPPFYRTFRPPDNAASGARAAAVPQMR
jgi:hypothetical protein